MKRALVILLAFAMVFSSSFYSVTGENMVVTAQGDSDLILHYQFQTNSAENGATIVDSSGNNNNGRIVGTGAQISNGILTLPGGSNTSGRAYVELPVGLFDNRNTLTINLWLKNETGSGNYCAMFFGTNNSPPTQYWLLNPAAPNGCFKSVFTNSVNTSQPWTTEVGPHDTVKTTSNWGMYTTVITPDSISGYYNGKLVGTGNLTRTVSDFGTDLVAFIGRSTYPDILYKGGVSDVRVYTRALTQDEINDLFAEGSYLFKQAFEPELERVMLKDNVSKDQIISSLYFPEKLNNVDITWSSSNTDIIALDGKVTRPVDKDANVTVTVTYLGSITSTFNLTVLKIEEGENQYLSLAKSRLVIPNQDNVRGNITLPSTIVVEGKTVNITWQSSDPDIITDKPTGENGKIPAGVVTRQSKDTKVTLTATLEFEGKTTQKVFDLTVKKAAQIDDYAAYMYVYFRANLYGTGESQQIHLATSKDGLFWDDMNNVEPILVSTLGTKGVRDPYIIRAPEGDRFYLIATDLDANGGEWHKYATSGSKSIMVWESDDLVNWSEQRMIEIAPENAGCMWAPEATYDPTTGEYVVYWASDTNKGDGKCIYYAKTRDFWTFTAPQIYKDKTASKTFIDTSMIEYNGQYYRFTKDETDNSVLLEKSDSILNEFTLVKEKIAGQTGVEGPAIFKFNGEDKWCLLLDGYTGANAGKGFYPLIAESPEDLDTGNFVPLNFSEYRMPTGAKHGCVLPITQKEYDSLMQKWGQYLVKPVEPDTSETIAPDLEYKFDESLSGNTVVNTGTSGKQNNGKLYYGATYVEDPEKGQVLYLSGGNSNTNSPYLEFPEGYFDGRDNISIFMDIKLEMDNQYFFTFGVGLDNQKYLFLRTRPYQIYAAFTVKSNPGEQTIVYVPESSIKNTWTNIGIVLERNEDGKHSTMKLYKDGELVGTETSLVANLSTIGANLKAYLGKAFYAADPYFKGYFDNVCVYNRALTDEQVWKVVNGSDEETTIELDRTSAEVEEGKTITLTATVTPPATVTWTSSDNDVATVDENGVVTGIKAGIATITASTPDGKTAQCIVTVIPAVKEKDYTVETTFNMTNLEPEKLLKAQISVTNNSGTEEPIIAIAALFDDKGRMINVSFISKAVAIGETENLVAGFKLPVDVTGHEVKVFVWKGNTLDDTSMEPLSNVVTLQ